MNADLHFDRPAVVRAQAQPATDDLFEPADGCFDPSLLCVAGGVLAHRAAVLGNAEAWKSILIDGALKDQGMVSFSQVMTPSQAEAVRLYVIDEANWGKTHLGAVAKGPQ